MQLSFPESSARGSSLPAQHCGEVQVGDGECLAVSLRQQEVDEERVLRRGGPGEQQQLDRRPRYLKDHRGGGKEKEYADALQKERTVVLGDVRMSDSHKLYCNSVTGKSYIGKCVFSCNGSNLLSWETCCSLCTEL